VNEKLLANWAETMVTIEVPDELVTQYKTIAENRPKPIALPQERQDLSEALNEAMLDPQQERQKRRRLKSAFQLEPYPRSGMVGNQP
jgi:hypothetical protein